MSEEKLSKAERSELKKQNRPAKVLALLLFAGITLINLAFYYQDILLGNEDLDRPHISQLVVIELIAIGIGFSSYYFPSRKLLKDLSQNKKITEENPVVSTFVKNVNGQPEYNVRLANSMNVAVERDVFKSVKKGDQLIVSYAPQSTHVFSAMKKS